MTNVTPPSVSAPKMPEPLRILVTGGTGQVGMELKAYGWPQGTQVLSPTRDELDLADITAIGRYFEQHQPDVVINPAAYTLVDRAEDEVAEAFRANALTPAILAELTAKAGIPLVHVSTDYVFDGKANRPYREDDTTNPANVYGASKRAGELAVLSGNRRSVVVRTAWVFSPHRGNFVKTMMRLAADKPSLGVVGDQLGCPTSARDLAAALATIALRMAADKDAPTGLYNFVNEGSTSWAGLAREVMKNLPDGGVPVSDITTADYPTPAVRPANSRLDTQRIVRDYGIRPRRWEQAVQETVAELIQQGAQ